MSHPRAFVVTGASAVDAHIYFGCELTLFDYPDVLFGQQRQEVVLIDRVRVGELVRVKNRKQRLLARLLDERRVEPPLPDPRDVVRIEVVKLRVVVIPAEVIVAKRIPNLEIKVVRLIAEHTEYLRLRRVVNQRRFVFHDIRCAKSHHGVARVLPVLRVHRQHEYLRKLSKLPALRRRVSQIDSVFVAVPADGIQVLGFIYLEHLLEHKVVENVLDDVSHYDAGLRFAAGDDAPLLGVQRAPREDCERYHE